MTQEELDALMAGGLDEDETDDAQAPENTETKTEQMHDYKLDGKDSWPPPPPTEDHKVVEQLDDVTKDSEVKATEIFDKLEVISDFIMKVENDANDVSLVIKKNIDIFDKMVDKFPDINIFKKSLKDNKKALSDIENLISNAQMSSDEIMMIMDIMQYQDIHRQKIERVVNVMRSLSRYMSTLFEGKIDDEKRVSSAKHIEGDTGTDVASTDDIEALLEQFGQ